MSTTEQLFLIFADNTPDGQLCYCPKILMEDFFMADLPCPKGMALQNQGDLRFPNEPAFCMEITEVSQDTYIASLPESQKSSYVTLLQRAALDWGIPGVVGSKKPATSVKAREADTYCANKYPQGATPTWTQWRIACGNKSYCTASGTLNHKEAAYTFDLAYALNPQGPVDVDFGPPNANGVKNMTGNASEWLRDKNENEPDGRYFTGGDWTEGRLSNLAAGSRRFYENPDKPYSTFGVRCVAPYYKFRK